MDGFMILKKTQIKQTALLLTLVFSLVSSYMVIGVERGVLGHEHHARHVAQHSASLCNWMCGASTFIHPVNPSFSQNSDAFFDNLAVYVEPFSGNLSVYNFRGRSPPVSLS